MKPATAYRFAIHKSQLENDHQITQVLLQPQTRKLYQFTLNRLRRTNINHGESKLLKKSNIPTKTLNMGKGRNEHERIIIT